MNHTVGRNSLSQFDLNTFGLVLAVILLGRALGDALTLAYQIWGRRRCGLAKSGKIDQDLDSSG